VLITEHSGLVVGAALGSWWIALSLVCVLGRAESHKLVIANREQCPRPAHIKAADVEGEPLDYAHHLGHVEWFDQACVNVPVSV
jgi:hypothetical protein